MDQEKTLHKNKEGEPASTVGKFYQRSFLKRNTLLCARMLQDEVFFVIMWVNFSFVFGSSQH